MIHRTSLGFVQEMYEWAFMDNRIKGALISTSTKCICTLLFRGNINFSPTDILFHLLNSGKLLLPKEEIHFTSKRELILERKLIITYWLSRAITLKGQHSSAWVSVACVNRVLRVRSVITHIPPPLPEVWPTSGHCNEFEVRDGSGPR